jgi:hypothetical protein
MIITERLINEIFELKVKIEDPEQKILLSKYQELIPMFDIRTKQIYPINKMNLHYRLIECDYRFINNEIVGWIKLLYDKYKNDKEYGKIYKKNLKIINNYDINTLIDTSYKTLYQFSKEFGLSVSICKRESFHMNNKFIKPYYTILELIKLGRNNGLLKTDITPESFLSIGYYNVCLSVSHNDISYDEIESHIMHIIKNNCISWITFYSFYGSFLFNQYLRNQKKEIDSFLNNGMHKIINLFKDSPKLINNYYIYRFIWDDSFIKNLKIGDIFSDQGFLSTTRDPFYSPALDGIFGLTLIKIRIPKNINGVGLLIENFSLFNKEEEFLLPPKTKLKLIARNNKFKYYHTNKTFEDLIHNKYEFEYIGNDFDQITLHIKDNIKIIDNIKEYECMSTDRISALKRFVEGGNQILIKVNDSGKEYLFNYLWFDSTEESSYSKLYYNKIKDGMTFSIFEEGYPYLTIEIGKQMVVNYINKLYFYNDNKTELDKDILDLLLEFGRIFCYTEAKIYHNYRNFVKFKTDDTTEMFHYTSFYNHSIYDFLKNDKKYLDYPFIKYNIGWFNIKELFNKMIKKEDAISLGFKKKISFKDIFIYAIENEVTFYDKLIYKINQIEKFNIVNNTKINILNEDYVTFEIYERLNSENRLQNFKSFIYDDILNDDFKTIFRQPIRRY